MDRLNRFKVAAILNDSLSLFRSKYVSKIVLLHLKTLYKSLGKFKNIFFTYKIYLIMKWLYDILAQYLYSLYNGNLYFNLTSLSFPLFSLIWNIVTTKGLHYFTTS